MDLNSILPEDTPGGWHHNGEDLTYTRENLYGYIDGGAELYLSYGFHVLYNRIYESEDNPDLIVDIFDMGSAENAYGIFSHSREMIDSTFGQGSQYTAGLLLFWKDRFYVSILASPETPESKQAVFYLARQIDTHIQDRGKLPSLVTFLPGENLIKESVRFFRHHFWLNTHYFISDENILQIDKDTDVVLAKYRNGNRSPVCILARYPSEVRADTAYASFTAYFLPQLHQNPVTQYDDSTWCGIRQNKSGLAIILNADSERIVRKILTAINWEE